MNLTYIKVGPNQQYTTLDTGWAAAQADPNITTLYLYPNGTTAYAFPTPQPGDHDMAIRGVSSSPVPVTIGSSAQGPYFDGITLTLDWLDITHQLSQAVLMQTFEDGHGAGSLLLHRCLVNGHNTGTAGIHLFEIQESGAYVEANYCELSAVSDAFDPTYFESGNYPWQDNVYTARDVPGASTVSFSHTRLNATAESWTDDGTNAYTDYIQVDPANCEVYAQIRYGGTGTGGDGTMIHVRRDVQTTGFVSGYRLAHEIQDLLNQSTIYDATDHRVNALGKGTWPNTAAIPNVNQPWSVRFVNGAFRVRYHVGTVNTATTDDITYVGFVFAGQSIYASGSVDEDWQTGLETDGYYYEITTPVFPAQETTDTGIDAVSTHLVADPETYKIALTVNPRQDLFSKYGYSLAADDLNAPYPDATLLYHALDDLSNPVNQTATLTPTGTTDANGNPQYTAVLDFYPVDGDQGYYGATLVLDSIRDMLGRSWLLTETVNVLADVDALGPITLDETYITTNAPWSGSGTLTSAITLDSGPATFQGTGGLISPSYYPSVKFYSQGNTDHSGNPYNEALQSGRWYENQVIYAEPQVWDTLGYYQLHYNGTATPTTGNNLLLQFTGGWDQPEVPAPGTYDYAAEWYKEQTADPASLITTDFLNYNALETAPLSGGKYTLQYQIVDLVGSANLENLTPTLNIGIETVTPDPLTTNDLSDVGVSNGQALLIIQSGGYQMKSPVSGYTTTGRLWVQDPADSSWSVLTDWVTAANSGQLATGNYLPSRNHRWEVYQRAGAYELGNWREKYQVPFQSTVFSVEFTTPTAGVNGEYTITPHTQVSGPNEYVTFDLTLRVMNDLTADFGTLTNITFSGSGALAYYHSMLGGALETDANGHPAVTIPGLTEQEVEGTTWTISVNPTVTAPKSTTIIIPATAIDDTMNEDASHDIDALQDHTVTIGSAWSNRRRSAVSLKNLTMGHTTFEPGPLSTTKTYQVTEPVRGLSLEVEESIPTTFPGIPEDWIRYEIHLGDTWYPITPVNRPAGTHPQVFHINPGIPESLWGIWLNRGESVVETGAPVTQFQIRATLTRPASQPYTTPVVYGWRIHIIDNQQSGTLN